MKKTVASSLVALSLLSTTPALANSTDPHEIEKIIKYTPVSQLEQERFLQKLDSASKGSVAQSQPKSSASATDNSSIGGQIGTSEESNESLVGGALAMMENDPAHSNSPTATSELGSARIQTYSGEQSGNTHTSETTNSPQAQELAYTGWKETRQAILGGLLIALGLSLIIAVQMKLRRR